MMIFEKIHTVPTSGELINKAFKRSARAMSGKTIDSRESRFRANESMLLTAANILTDNLANIVRRFPSFERLPRFYYELTDILVGVEKLKMSLASVDWASRKIHEVARSNATATKYQFLEKIRRKYRRSFASMMLPRCWVWGDAMRSKEGFAPDRP